MGEREHQVAAVRRVPSSTTAITLSSANFHRGGVIIHNDSTAVLFGKFGAGASSTDFTFRLTAQSSFEHRTGRIYRGVVTGIWDAENGAAQVTELV